MNWNISRISHLLFIVLAGGYLLLIGKALLLPMAFAVIISFLLYPLCRKLESWRMPRIPAILLSMLLVLLVLAGILTLFSSQFYSLGQEYPRFQSRFNELTNELVNQVNRIPYLENNLDNVIREMSSTALGVLQKILGSTFSNTTALLGYVGMIVVYVFLFLLYRSAFKKFIIERFKENRQREIREMLYGFQEVTWHYFSGLLFSMLILGSINSIGLWIIGIEHAFLFGFFAAFLSVIPYIGTTIGGLLPFLYALLSYNEIWKPLAVIGMYQLVQALEGNYITPKIVGSKVSVNALVAIIALIFGGIFWGIPGMILSIPTVALSRVLLDTFDSTKPYAHLLSSDFSIPESPSVKPPASATPENEEKKDSSTE